MLSNTRRSVILAAALSAPALLSGCIPVAISHALATSSDEKIIETVRRAYILHRTADGKSEKQIATEIAKIDRAWEIDLALSHGDLMASTKPNMLKTYDCYNDATDEKCAEKVKAQRQVLKEAGITLTAAET